MFLSNIVNRHIPHHFFFKFMDPFDNLQHPKILNSCSSYHFWLILKISSKSIVMVGVRQVRQRTEEHTACLGTSVLEGILKFNPLRAKFFRGNINKYLHFVSFLHIDTTQVAEILPPIRQEPTYST